MSMAGSTPQEQQPLREVAGLFLKLGCIAFGGPAAHIAMMRDEVVRRRGWMDDAHFLDLLGATNLIPGPNSTEMAIHIGQERAGWRGLIVAGTLFILPAMLIVLALAWAYVRFGTTPQATAILYGIKPVIIAVVIQALIALGRTAIKSWLAAVVGLGVLVLALIGVSEIPLLLAAGLVMLLAINGRRYWQLRHSTLPLLALLPGIAIPFSVEAAPVSLTQLFLVFLKIGSVLYGSGYVLLAFLHTDLVDRLHWLTDRQLLDAVAIGQFTPGPVFTTATFIGYIVARWPGAILATLGIFLPSFIFVALSRPLIPRLRRSPWFGALLDGVNVGALGLMAAVTIRLGQAALVDSITVALALVAALLLIRYKVNSAWLVLGGGVLGLLAQQVLR
jgi:chromate transporter